MEQGRAGVVLPRVGNVRERFGGRRDVGVNAGRVGEVLGEARPVLPLHKKGAARAGEGGYIQSGKNVELAGKVGEGGGGGYRGPASGCCVAANTDTRGGGPFAAGDAGPTNGGDQRKTGGARGRLRRAGGERAGKQEPRRCGTKQGYWPEDGRGRAQGQLQREGR